jgi:hypothetical protein
MTDMTVFFLLALAISFLGIFTYFVCQTWKLVFPSWPASSKMANDLLKSFHRGIDLQWLIFFGLFYLGYKSGAFAHSTALGLALIGLYILERTCCHLLCARIYRSALNKIRGLSKEEGPGFAV